MSLQALHKSLSKSLCFKPDIGFVFFKMGEPRTFSYFKNVRARSSVGYVVRTEPVSCGTSQFRVLSYSINFISTIYFVLYESNIYQHMSLTYRDGRNEEDKDFSNLKVILKMKCCYRTLSELSITITNTIEYFQNYRKRYHCCF